MPSAGTILDPRCKLEFFKNANCRKEWIDCSKKIVVDVWKNKYKVTDVDEGVTADPKPSTLIFDNMFGCATASKKNLDDDLTRYLAHKPVHADRLQKDTTGIDGALGWWKIHQSKIPQLSRMARDYLGILGSGMAVENFFCSGGDLVGPRRHNMSPQSITMCMCLKNWMETKSSQQDIVCKFLQALRYKVLGFEDFDE
ncbi:unnamed protein product [Allacma fusca]|uniref:HAT C-terminal dimerisation domain-containing protein n=1 Tax=Allacma fusca TaxID=39272 RepID=A0A8J2KRT1_9HEXA|nr:unnamed protein product [Allacma fusca]